MRAALLLLLVLLTACQSTPTADQVAAARRRADTAAKDLVTRLMDRLSEALAEGDTASALEVCGRYAQELTERVAFEPDVAVRRTTLRCRNPKNVADPFERAWLEQETPRYGGAEPPEPRTLAEVVPRPDGGHELRYLKPIVLQTLCVQCHGPEARIDPSVKAVLARRYPGDQATGYRPGELRGAISVRVKLD